MKKIRLAGAGLIVGSMAIHGALAVDVYIHDDNNENGHLCPQFSSMQSIDAERIDLYFNGQCINSGGGQSDPGVPVIVGKTINVTGGSSATIDVSAGASNITLPLPANAVTVTGWNPAKGSVSRNGTLVTYSANATADGDTDNFTYTLKDASGQTSAPATVAVNISSGGTSGGGTTGGNCQTGGNIVCKGYSLNITNGGQIKNIPVAANAIHVWEFEYISRSDSEIIFVFEPTVQMDVTINKKAGDMNDAAYAKCKLQDGGIQITANTSYSSWACPLVEGDRYFLNVRNKENVSGKYGILR